MAESWILDISDELIGRLDTADKAIEKLGETSEAIKTKMVNSFKAMADEGVGALIQKLNEAKSAISGMASTDFKLNIDTTETKNAISQVTELADAVNKIDSASKNKATFGNTGMNIAELKEQIKAINEELTDVENGLDAQQQQRLVNLRDYYKQDLKLQEENIRKKNVADALSFSSNTKNLADERQAIEYLIAARNKLSNADANYAEMLNNLNTAIRKHEENIKRSAKTDSEIAEEAKENAEKRRRAALKENEAYERRKKILMGKWYSSTPEMALNFSANTKSINEQLQAIKYLTEARKNLTKSSPNDKKYAKEVAKLTNEIKRQKENVRQLTKANDELSRSHSRAADTMAQLRNMTLAYFSVDAILNYITQMANVRGEFELQQKSLQVLLQSREKANVLWEQITALAVKSPFRVTELVSYTRQLAAYQIESDKLFDTTKRLADVSAGLGVDMQRLILAYGQVRSASFLRGTELRQFTEAGIPMLEELAKYFTEIRGEAVSVGDVFDMISKRMVRFADVDAVFQRLTSSGGLFYNMQEKQADTLAGKISNLKDSIDLMLNDIGKSNSGILTFFVDLAKSMAEHWESIAVVIKMVIGVLMALKLQAIATSPAMMQLAAVNEAVAASSGKGVKYMHLLTIGMRKLGTSIAQFFTKGNIWVIIITAIATALYELYSATRDHNKAIEDVNKLYDEMSNKIGKIQIAFDRAQQSNKLDLMKQQLEEMVNLLNDEYNLDINIDVDGMSFQEVVETMDKLSNLANDANSNLALFNRKLEEATEWTAADDIKEDLLDLSNAIDTFQNNLTDNVGAIANQYKRWGKYQTERGKQALLEMASQTKENESEYDYYQRKLDNFNAFWDEYKKAYLQLRKEDSVAASNLSSDMEKYLGVISKSSLKLRDWGVGGDYNEAINELRNFIKTINVSGLTDEQKKVFIRVAIDKNESIQALNAETRQIIELFMKQEWKLPLTLDIMNKEKKNPLTEWQEEYNKIIDEAIKNNNKLSKSLDIKKIIDGATQAKDQLQIISGDIEQLTEKIRIYKSSTSNFMRFLYNDEELKNLEAQLSVLNMLYSFLGGKPKKTNSGGRKQEKDYWQEMANVIRDVNKEITSLNKDLPMQQARTRALEKYNNTLTTTANILNKKIGRKVFDVGAMDLSTNVGMLEAMRKLWENMPSKMQETKDKVHEMIVDLENNPLINDAKKATEKLVKSYEEMLDQYNLLLELNKLGIDKDMANNLFGIETTNLRDIRVSLEEDINKEISEERKKDLQNLLDKIRGMENKEQIERLKTYVSYLKKASSEAVNIKMDEVKKLQEIDKLDLSKIDDEDERERVRERMRQGVRTETQNKLEGQKWDDFKKSPVYEMMYEDLDNMSTDAIDYIIKQINLLQLDLSKLDVSNAKDYMNTLNKLQDELIGRNPLKQSKLLKASIDSLGKSYKDLLDDFAKYNSELIRGKQIVDDIDIVTSAIPLEGGLEQLGINEFEKFKNAIIQSSQDEALKNAVQSAFDIGKQTKDFSQLISLIKKEEKAIKGVSDKQRETNKNTEKTINTTKQGINDNEDYINAQKKLIANAKEWGETIKKGYSAVLDIVTELGADEDSLGYELAQAGESVIDLIVNVITLQAQFKILGVAANSALAIVGWIAMALQTIAELISLVLGQHDKSLQRQIETIEDRVERLQKSFEKLEKAIDNAYDVSRLKRWKDSAESNLRQQIAATQKMIDLEEDKKKSDKDKIKDWQNDIESMQEQLKELQDNFYQSLGAFGSDEQYKDAAESFADAWYSSINDVGEGISGLEDTFNEFMDNVVKKQLLMRGSQRILEPLLKMIDASVEDGIVTADEMQRVQNEFNDKTKYALDEYYKTIYDLYDGMLGVGGDLSDLQKGISSITEPQAAAIEAYLNTIRFFVSKIYESSKVLEQNTKYMQDNPLLAELQAQTTILRDIYDTLRSVVGRGNNSVHTGAYIKVLA